MQEREYRLCLIRALRLLQATYPHTTPLMQREIDALFVIVTLLHKWEEHSGAA